MAMKSNCVSRLPRSSRRFRRGSVLVYSLVLMTIMLAMTSFAVDYGRLQLIKTQLQRNADSAARGSLEMYMEGSSSGYTYWGPAMTWSTFNPVDNNSGVAPTVSFTWGYWNSTTKTFTAGTGTPVAVQVTVSRTAANGNAVPLTFPLLNGKSILRTTCDVSATAIAVLSNSTSVTNHTISSQSDIWLSGMPSGSSAVSDGDTVQGGQGPPLVMNVTPGTVLTFTNVSGSVKHDPTLTADNANGSTIYSHNSDWASEPAVENDIGNIYAPIDSLIGVFLTSNAPNTQSAPTTTLDYTTQAARDQVNTTGLQVQEPFFIGTGVTSVGSTTKTYVVPPGATQLYLGTMDGHQWSNNSGSFTATINQLQQVYLVK